MHVVRYFDSCVTAMLMARLIFCLIGVAHIPQYDYDFIDITLSHQERAALHKQQKQSKK